MQICKYKLCLPNAFKFFSYKLQWFKVVPRQGWLQNDVYLHWLIAFVTFGVVVRLSLLCFLYTTSLKWSDLNLAILCCLSFSTRVIGCALSMLVRMISMSIPVSFSNVTAILSIFPTSSVLGSVMPLTRRHRRLEYCS